MRGEKREKEGIEDQRKRRQRMGRERRDEERG